MSVHEINGKEYPFVRVRIRIDDHTFKACLRPLVPSRCPHCGMEPLEATLKYDWFTATPDMQTQAVAALHEHWRTTGCNRRPMLPHVDPDSEDMTWEYNPTQSDNRDRSIHGYRE